jgi:hypothetical protein
VFENLVEGGKPDLAVLGKFRKKIGKIQKKKSAEMHRKQWRNNRNQEY